jgi:Mrp family chromosome partitioning ATPase
VVERLKIAIAKARAAREKAAGAGAGAGSQGMSGIPASVAAVSPAERGEPSAAGWSELEAVELDPRHLEAHRVIAQSREDPAHVAFDVLRTRLLRAFKKQGWTRLGITSPDKGCGKTFVATNLALSLSRQADIRAVLIDLDLRSPAVAKVLGIRHSEPVRWFLQGDVPLAKYLRRVGGNLAVGLNSERVRDAAEVLLAPHTAVALDTIRDRLAPDVVIYDLPPMLTGDDVLGFLPQLDCVLLVVGGGRTRPEQVTECERLLADQIHLLGVLLNQAEGANSSLYAYE